MSPMFLCFMFMDKDVERIETIVECAFISNKIQCSVLMQVKDPWHP